MNHRLSYDGTWLSVDGQTVNQSFEAFAVRCENEACVYLDLKPTHTLTRCTTLLFGFYLIYILVVDDIVRVGQPVFSEVWASN